MSLATRTELLGHRMPFYGWVVAVVMALVTFSAGTGQAYIFSIFLDPILADSDLTRTTVSAMFGIGTAIAAVAVVIMTSMVDRYGGRYLLTGIGLALGGSAFITALSHSHASYFVGFTGLRMFALAATSAASVAAAQWFIRYRGRVMAVGGIGFAISNAMIPLLAQYLIDHFGWRTAFMVLGTMVWFVMALPCLILVRNRPEDVGLYPDGAATPPLSEPLQPDRGGLGAYLGLGRSAGFWVLAFAMTTTPFVSTALIFHQAGIFAEHGLGSTTAAGAFVFYAISGAGLTALTGILLDRFGPKGVLIGNYGVILLAVCMLFVVHSPLMAFAYTLVLGGSTGMERVLARAVWPHYYGRRNLGRVQGLGLLVVIIGRAIAPVSLATMHDATGGYRVGLYVLLGVTIVSIVGVALFRPQQTAAG